jgi:rhamnopyranosyl-N-acetylglucosaminyl-diphospho-decaprenol beta-1,3/1,4-galactofuranosyltransferase
MKTVAAVVVTYNRLEDLKKCIASLRTQTRPADEIFVINNGSTDGTATWLASQTALNAIVQSNQGGAGGFATGISLAFEAGHDGVWCMDDDCVATPGALETLLAAPNIGPCIKNCISISSVDSTELAFYVDRPNRSYRKVEDMAGVDLVFGVASLFNGTLISAEVVEKIGLPDKTLFIWGDEVEYMTRAIKMGFPVVTVPKAVFYHPPSFDRHGIPWPAAWKMYYAVRNQRRVFQNIHGPRMGFLVYLSWSIRETLRQLILRRRLNRTYNFLIYSEATLDGVFNRFSKRPETIVTLRLYRFLHRSA